MDQQKNLPENEQAVETDRPKGELPKLEEEKHERLIVQQFQSVAGIPDSAFPMWRQGKPLAVACAFFPFGLFVWLIMVLTGEIYAQQEDTRRWVPMEFAEKLKYSAAIAGVQAVLFIFALT